MSGTAIVKVTAAVPRAVSAHSVGALLKELPVDRATVARFVAGRPEFFQFACTHDAYAAALSALDRVDDSVETTETARLRLYAVIESALITVNATLGMLRGAVRVMEDPDATADDVQMLQAAEGV